MSETETTNEEVMKEAKKASEEAHEALEEVREVEAEVQELRDEVSEEKKELEEFKNKFYYLAAEMENMKKRHDRDLQNQIKFGSEKILKNLLDVVDNLERTMMAIEKDEDDKVKNIYTGIDMVKNQFLDVLKQNGLEQVEAIGKIFDPNFHEALAQQPAEGKQDDEVIQVYQQGYSLNGRLIRAAKVVVAKN
ncbi:nucleotide exchange factor GrpE [Bacteriovorax sp. Seq25_V]|uniref:nucleotide exchange factor GrpE n=1 Tax=Bacteriovorax sp. Seq25_V TaxID=1201288 RepID=UPI000389F5D0|nr:nucleotide exchange factor GrpE [Bacteriovorax sp. Seq25_V]EQC46793.1 co-chaperone GrpE [Bacteriovorax sp. Seq25_V]